MNAPLSCMLDQHRAGRALTMPMSSWTSRPRALTTWPCCAHIEKENCVLFEMADQCLTGSETVELVGLYAQIESDPDCSTNLQRCRTRMAPLLEAGR